MLGVENTVKKKLIQSHKGLCLVEKLSTQHGKPSPFSVTDSVSSSVFAHSLAQQHLQGGKGPLYCFNYKFLPGLPHGNHILWIILRGCSKYWEGLWSHTALVWGVRQPWFQLHSWASYWASYSTSLRLFPHLLKGTVTVPTSSTVSTS